MNPPWHDLKQSEVLALQSRATGSLSADVIDPMRRLFDDCKNATDADEAICYHGAIALIHEFDGDLDSAIKHRKIEISMILELHELARKNPNDRPALVNYDEQELQHRNRILDDLARQIAR